MPHLTRISAVGSVLAVVSLGAMPLSGAGEDGARSIAHVRGGDALSRRLLDEVVSRSPTAASLVAALEQSDLIVTVVTGLLPRKLNGTTQVVTTKRGVRYVRVVLRLPSTTPELLAVLGHELRHAVEIASMPEVQDEATFGIAYRQRGYATSRGGFFETKAAIETGRIVAREVSRPW